MNEDIINSRIENLEKRLNASENSEEKAEIADKIKELKLEIKKSKDVIGAPRETTHIDAPVIADRMAGAPADLKLLERGQIMNSGSLYSVEI